MHVCRYVWIIRDRHHYTTFISTCFHYENARQILPLHAPARSSIHRACAKYDLPQAIVTLLSVHAQLHQMDSVYIIYNMLNFLNWQILLRSCMFLTYWSLGVESELLSNRAAACTSPSFRQRPNKKGKPVSAGSISEE